MCITNFVFNFSTQLHSNSGQAQRKPKVLEMAKHMIWEPYAAGVTVDFILIFYLDFLLTTCYTHVLIMAKLYFIRFPPLFRHAVGKANKINLMVSCLQNLELSIIKNLTKLLN